MDMKRNPSSAFLNPQFPSRTFPRTHLSQGSRQVSGREIHDRATLNTTPKTHAITSRLCNFTKSLVLVCTNVYMSSLHIYLYVNYA